MKTKTLNEKRNTLKKIISWAEQTKDRTKEMHELFMRDFESESNDILSFAWEVHFLFDEISDNVADLIRECKDSVNNVELLKDNV
jgi:hypothetical protein